PLNFHRYEAEDAQFSNAVAVPNRQSSNLRRARLAAGPEGRLRFVVNSTGGQHALVVRFSDLGLASQPSIVVNGSRLGNVNVTKTDDGWQLENVSASLLPGFNTIDVDGGA